VEQLEEVRGPLAQEGWLYLHICVWPPPRVLSCVTVDGADRSVYFHGCGTAFRPTYDSPALPFTSSVGRICSVD